MSAMRKARPTLSHGCDLSDTENSPSLCSRLLPLIHEIERLEMVRVCSVHPTCCHLVSRVCPVSGLGHGPRGGRRLYDSRRFVRSPGPGTTMKYGLAREIIHKQAGRTRATSPALEEELTAWTGATTPPAVRWTRSCSSRSATRAPPFSRSTKPNRCAGGAR